MTRTGNRLEGGGDAQHCETQVPGRGMTSKQKQTSFATENETTPLSEGDHGDATLLHHHHDNPRVHLSTTSNDDGRGLWMGAPPLPVAPMSDKRWAVAFAVNLVITLYSAVYFFPSALIVLGPMLTVWGWGSLSDVVAWTILTCLLGVASAVAAASIALFASRFMTRLQVVLGVYVLVLVAAVRMLPEDLLGPGAAIAPVVCALISGCFLRYRRAQFAEENLKVATAFVSSTPQIFCWALCATVVRYVLLAVGIAACVGSIAAVTPPGPDIITDRPDNCRWLWMVTGLSWGCCAGMVPECDDRRTSVFLPMFWTASVLWSSSVGANVVAATMANSVASRWSEAGNGRTAWESCHRVLRSSLGSLCKIAALDCLSHPLRFLVGRFSGAFWVADVLMLCLRFGVSYVLLQLASFVGIYRSNFGQAVRHTGAMFRVHGRTLFMNDAMVLAGFSLSFVAISAGPAIITVYSSVGSVFSRRTPSPGVLDLLTIVYMMATFATLEVVFFAFKAVFVCLVQVPDSMAENQDQSPHSDLRKAWPGVQLLHAPGKVAREDGQA